LAPGLIVKDSGALTWILDEFNLNGAMALCIALNGQLHIAHASAERRDDPVGVAGHGVHKN
jgi:hypothetical protein